MFAMGPAFFEQSGVVALALSGTFAAATLGVAYSSSIAIAGGVAPYSLTGGTGVASGSLPTGLSLAISGSSLVLSGTPTTTTGTSAFTVSVNSSDAQTATSAQSVTVLPAALSSGLHCDGADGSTVFADVTGKTWARIGTTTAISTAASLFGGASLSVGPTTGSATANGVSTAPSADFDFGVGEFTIEWAQKWNASTSYATAFSRDTTSAGVILMQTGNGDQKYKLYWGSLALMTEASAPGASTAFRQYALCRQNSGTTSTFLLYRDGVLTASASATTSDYSFSAPTKGWTWGAYPDGTYATASNLDELQIYKGLCKYPNGTTYTPATGPFSP